MKKTYFVLNDTRYDNHHGCLTVIDNLHSAMKARGWECLGSLPVSSTPSKLTRYFPFDKKIDLVIVNGEGTLHHSKRNSRNLLTICSKLQKDYSLVLINALWQDNDIEKNRATLTALKAIYTRDKRSQKELNDAGINAKYAPDLTFLKYPTFEKNPQPNKYACTDSVINSWSIKARDFCDSHDNIDYLTMYTGKITHKRGIKDHIKSLKTTIYPFLYKSLKVKVPPRYRVLPTETIEDTNLFIENLNRYQAVCVARYHTLCFVIQQNIPFVIVSSNSHKSKALLDEVGIPDTDFYLNAEDINLLPQKLSTSAEQAPVYQSQIKAFCVNAKELINTMFDDITKRSHD